MAQAAGCSCLAHSQLGRAPGLRTAPSQQQLRPPLAPARRRRAPPPMASHPPSAPPPGADGSSADRAKRLEDADRRSTAAAARSRLDPEVMERVDAVLESVPPSRALFTLRLLTHAVDAREVAHENIDAINDEFFAELKALLTSQAFKQATNAAAPGNTQVLAAGVLGVFDSAWRAALEARAAAGGGQQ